MDVLKIAREAGLAVLLEGRIGQQNYSSVSGSQDALLRFVKAIRIETLHEHRLCLRLRLHAFLSPCRGPTQSKQSRSSCPVDDPNVYCGPKKRARRYIRHPMFVRSR